MYDVVGQRLRDGRLNPDAVGAEIPSDLAREAAEDAAAYVSRIDPLLGDAATEQYYLLIQLMVRLSISNCASTDSLAPTQKAKVTGALTRILAPRKTWFLEDASSGAWPVFDALWPFAHVKAALREG
ncbi:hypothetical protein DMC25_15575 [Caulobacter sp. D4A]|uniref:hypothetical protein n=1 Tax=unclassified Caulobacter TaxID=2648921 RepID=UPI000D9FECC6|nr:MULTISPECIES: hypothetical protein [unclassified Caulobacter]PXA85323.1 hypothetical protein DMC25_15575 [Caulobacter sp. D4A]